MEPKYSVKHSKCTNDFIYIERERVTEEINQNVTYFLAINCSGI